MLAKVETFRGATGDLVAPGDGPTSVSDGVLLLVRAERLIDALVGDQHLNRMAAGCTAVEYFGAVRRHIFERSWMARC